MPKYRVRQSKPLAVIGAVFGAAVLVAGVVTVGFGTWTIWLWLTFGVGIIAFNLWSAFGRRGHDEVIESGSGGASATGPGGDGPATVSYRVRPSKGRALLVAAGAAAIAVFGGLSMLRGGGPPVWFAALFLAAGVFIVGATLWSAFSPNGRIQTIETDADTPPPARPGQVISRD